MDTRPIIPPPDRTKPHTRYYVDGKQVPGVTTICGHMDKPALKYWANRLGLNGIDVKNYVDEKAKIGTCAHYLIECDVKQGRPNLSGFAPADVDLAENGFLKWLEWRKQNEPFELIGSEMQLIDPVLRYGGTLDIYAKIRGDVFALIDIKTSDSGIYPDMELHVGGGYANLARVNSHEVDEVWILRVGRSSDSGFDTKKISGEHQQIYFSIFSHLRAIHDLKKVVKWK